MISLIFAYIYFFFSEGQLFDLAGAMLVSWSVVK